MLNTILCIFIPASQVKVIRSTAKGITTLVCDLNFIMRNLLPTTIQVINITVIHEDMWPDVFSSSLFNSEIFGKCLIHSQPSVKNFSPLFDLLLCCSFRRAPLPTAGRFFYNPKTATPSILTTGLESRNILINLFDRRYWLL